MFERFTNDARQAVHQAQDEARALQHRAIGTAHLLLAVSASDGAGARALRSHGLDADTLRTRIRQMTGPGGDPIDGAALAAIGIDLDEVRRAVEATFGAGALESGQTRRGHIPFTAQAKKAIELSLRSAVALRHKFICSGHILLGLLRAPGEDNLAIALLTEAGVDIDALRETATNFIQADAA